MAVAARSRSRRHATANAIEAVCYGLRNILDPIFDFREISVLGYHSISDSPNPGAISAKAFAEHLRYLAGRDCSFISLPALSAWMRGEATLPRKAVAITFDDGHGDFITAALPILERYNVPVTLFAMGDPAAANENIGNLAPLLSNDEIRAIEHPLVTIGYHSNTHADLGKLSNGSLQGEIRSPFPARFFAYPGGSHSPDAAAVVAEHGYDAAFGVGRRLVDIADNRFFLPRVPIDGGLKPWQVGMRTSKAVNVYKLWRR